MRLEKWFISNLDDSQRRIIVEDIDKNIVVQGAAGSGKQTLQYIEHCKQRTEALMLS